MAARRPGRPSYRRALRIYLVAIVGPTLLLLYLGLQSVRRQREAIAGLTASNLRLSGERLVEELERRTGQLATACLRDPELAAVGFPSVETPPAMRQMRTRLEKLRQRHPVARHFFILEGNTVRYPRRRAGGPQRLDDYLAGENAPVRQRFAALWEDAEDLELRQQQPERALPIYQQCRQLPVSDAAQALALSRAARCLRKLKRPQEAAQGYRALAEQYGSLYDMFHRPYAIVAAFEVEPSDPQLLARLRDELLAGRWELSLEQVEYFLARLGERLPPQPGGETEYLDHLRLARALEEGFRHQGPVRPAEVYAYTLTSGQTGYQIYYTSLPRETLPGFAVDLNWVASQLLSRCRNDLGMVDAAAVVAAGARLDPGAEARASFRSLFPFWELSVRPAAGASPAPARMWVFAAVTLLVLSVLVLGVVLLQRDVWREMDLNRVRSDFVSGVSHELKTPLTLIRLYAETLLDEEEYPEKQRKGFYQIILRESDRLNSLIEKVLDFSRIERGRKEYHLREGDLAAVIGRTVEVYGQYLRRRGFSMETRIAANLPPARFDSDAVSQALVNLLDNAVKYSGESNYVGVELRAGAGSVILEVEDRGIGIPAGEREKIFERFYRAADGTGKGGYGLGLFLVKHIMEAHGGRVEVESEVGRGSRFRLVFPSAARQEEVRA